MDPSSFARVFGVQSESNKVTVTRVASNEIVYRRAVDTYRRDMASTMTGIQREQKKLKRNMRHYRRRLREARNLPVKKSKPFKIGWIAYDTDTSFIKSTTSKLQVNTVSDPLQNTLEKKVKHKDSSTNGNAHTKHNKSSRLQDQVETFLKSVDDHIGAVATAKEEDKASDNVEEDVPTDKNGRRRFIFGPSQIGSSHDTLKYLESEADVNVEKHDVLSDSSSEGGNLDDEVFRETTNKESPNKKIEHLIRLNSAYFTPIEMKDDSEAAGTSSQIIPSMSKADNDANSHVFENKDPENAKVSSGCGEKENLPSLFNDNATKSYDVSGKKISRIFFNLNKAEQKVSNEPSADKLNDQISTEQTPKVSKSERKTSKLNFGDLIKFQHGVNTKKLFSMVDQLASKYGVVSTDTKKKKNRKGLSINNDHYTIPEIDRASEAKSSFFYAMKYGYGKPDAPLQETSVKSPGTLYESTTTETRNQVEQSRESRTESLGALTSVTSGRDMPDNTVKTVHKERKVELPPINNDPPTSHSRQSIFSNFDEKEIDQNSIAHHSRGNNKSTNRRSSILDASNYVSNMRRKSVVQERLKVFEAQYNADRLALHNRRVNTRKDVISEHQRKADDSKIPWTSALGSMKLVHTLGDLTDYI